MISTSFNSYASLAIFFILSVLFCFFFFFEHETIYTSRVLAVFDFYCRREACNLTGCENHQNSDSISFTLWGFSSLLTLQYGAWHVYKLCLVLLLLFVDLPVPDFHFQLKKKKTREKSRRKSNIVQLSRWRDSFSSALCSILSKSTLFQPMTTCVISELYYKIMRKQSADCGMSNFFMYLISLVSHFLQSIPCDLVIR